MGLRAPIEAAVFDIGATLVTGPSVAPNKVIAALLGNADAADVASVIMTQPFESADSVCAELERRFGAVTDSARSEMGRLWTDQMAAPKEIDGASDAVIALKRRGLRIGLLSDIWSPYYSGVRKAIPDIIAAADAIMLSFESGSRKPDHSSFYEVLEQLDVDASRAVMIGDTYKHDLRPALEVGMQAVWVLARPEREWDSIVELLNGEALMPTAAVRHVSDIRLLPGLESAARACNQGEQR